ncbi:hypothetical protein [Gracilibacillus dipsosauri]|uniref:hypothetical protein n=1 Tax=Gracilibacillus dipsosauri TaxID=178340 RepID=UPI00240935B4
MNDIIINALQPMGLPVAFEIYRGNEPEYIRFFYLPQVDFYSNDDESYNVVYIQVDIFTPGNPKEYAKQVKQLLKENNFNKNFEHQLFEEDTELYHYILRFYKVEEAI